MRSEIKELETTVSKLEDLIIIMGQDKRQLDSIPTIFSDKLECLNAFIETIDTYKYLVSNILKSLHHAGDEIKKNYRGK